MIKEKMIELNADGVDFMSISAAFTKRDYIHCKIYISHTREEILSGNIKYYPKSPYVFWKVVNGVKKYIE